MYSLVLMMAMNGALEAPEAHPHHHKKVVSSGCCGSSAWGLGYQTTWSVYPGSAPQGCPGCQGTLSYAPRANSMQSAEPAQEPAKPKGETPKKPLTINLMSASLIRSDVKVEMPQGAKLFVNDIAVAMEKDGRFETPALPLGEVFAYNFKAVIEEQGEKKSVVRQVTFKAGEALRVDLREQK